MYDLEYEEGSIFSDLKCFSDEDFGSELGKDVSYDGEVYCNPPQDDIIESLRIMDMAPANAANQVVLQEGLWEFLPTELLEKILMLLPPAAHFRFRSVCKRWKTMVTSPGWLQRYAEDKPRPSCIVMCPLGTVKANFFCHSELRWFDIPLNPISDLDVGWELVAADGGLFCYQRCDWVEGLWLCVCNPLTQSSRLLPPKYVHGQVPLPLCDVLRLIVNKQDKTFKIVVLVRSSNPPSTAVYDSATSLWTIYNSFPQEEFRSVSFVWKNVIYCECFQPGKLLAFGINSGVWKEVETELPCLLERRHYIINNNDSVLLVQFGNYLEERISIWKLDDVSSSTSTTFSRSQWVKLLISLPSPSFSESMIKYARSCFSQSDSICFSSSFTNICFMYNFESKSWRMMPCLGKARAAYSWFEWEPRLDYDVGEP